MIVHTNIKDVLKKELIGATMIWVASAMVTKSGLKFIQDNIAPKAIQYYLIGIDLNTQPEVFEKLYANQEHNARIYKAAYTYHPKVYLIQFADYSMTAFIGSSNTTTWGLEKNVEMNFQIKDRSECAKLLVWFNDLYSRGHLITPEFIESYKSSFEKIFQKTKEVENEVDRLKLEIAEGNGQLFSINHHRIFNEQYHRVENQDLKTIRKEVRNTFLKLHSRILPRFKAEGLYQLHPHHQKREVVSRHFFNRFSGNYINAMWLHYGKSEVELNKYDNGDKSINNPSSFINNIRLQVIIQEGDIGLWLVVGRGGAGINDRKYLKTKLAVASFRAKFYSAFKNLGKGYWINVSLPISEGDITDQDQLAELVMSSRLENYFIIGKNVSYFDQALSEQKIADTVVDAFKKLYILYEMVKDQ